VKAGAYSRAEREADDRVADHLAAEQLEAILREGEQKIESAPKARAAKLSYLQ
jgi:hypothetical protein